MEDLLSIQTKNGRTIYYCASDQRGSYLASREGNANPGSLALWNAALGIIDWKTVVDIGANYGEMLTAEALISADETKIIAFEPNTQILPALRKTIDELPISIDLRAIALSSNRKDGEAFYVDPHWSGTSALNRDAVSAVGTRSEDKQLLRVQVSTLDDELASEDVSTLLIKIDAEGAEPDILRGARCALTRASSFGIIVEILHSTDKEIQNLFQYGLVYALDKSDCTLKQLKSDSVCSIRDQLDRDNIYSQDLLVLSCSIDQIGVPKASRHGHPLTVKSRALTHRGSMDDKSVIYTALFGSYEDLNEQPSFKKESNNFDYVCFTDNPDLSSETWEIRLVQPRFPDDIIRSARFLKITGCELLSDYSSSLWIDNTVILKHDPAEILITMLEGTTDVALPYHSYRQSVSAEFDRVAECGLDDQARILEQLMMYLKHDRAILQEHVFWTAIIARKHTDAVFSTMRLWMDHVNRFSRRDQLSINHILAHSGLSVKGFSLDSFESQYHAWPVARNRNENRRFATIQDNLKGAAVELGRQQNLNDKLSSENQRLAAEYNRLSSELQEIRTSATWRLARKLTRIKDALRSSRSL